MDLPTYDEYIDPLLRVLIQHPEGLRAADAQELVASLAKLSEEAKLVLLPSGRQAVYRNRIGWAHDRLKRAGLSSSPKRALWVITPAGAALARKYPSGLPPEEIERLSRVAPDSRVPGVDEVPDTTSMPVTTTTSVPVAGPEERIETALQELHLSVAADLLEQIAANTPEFFERLVLDLLHAMGYGSDPDARELGAGRLRTALPRRHPRRASDHRLSGLSDRPRRRQGHLLRRSRGRGADVLTECP